MVRERALCRGPRTAPRADRPRGRDLGVCAYVATSDGQLVTEGRFGRKAAGQLTSAQRSLSTKQRGSLRRGRAVERVARAHRKVANQRKDLAHKVSRELVDSYDLIVVEDLVITNMVRRPKPRTDDEGVFRPNGARVKAGLDRSIHDAGWGVLTSMLAYKAEEAGRDLIVVDPRHTSQRCSACGHTAGKNQRSQAEFRCQGCGFTHHAHINAAINILRAGRAQRALARAGSGNCHYPLITPPTCVLQCRPGTTGARWRRVSLAGPRPDRGGDFARCRIPWVLGRW